MKKVIALLLVLVVVFALVGCNIAPNVPRVTPRVTYGPYPNGSTGYVPYGANTRGTYNGTNGTAMRPVAPGRLG